MIVKMRKGARPEDIQAVEDKLHELGYQTGKLVGTEIVLIGVYGDVSQLPVGEIQEMAGVDELIRISRAYKRAAQKGDPTDRRYVHFPVGNVMIGEDLVVIAGPCSVESERQIMEAARMVKEAGGHILRGGVHKYRSSPYSGWEGVGADSEESLRRGLEWIVKAGREYDLPVAVEILDHTKIHLYEDVGVDCLQIGEPNSRNTVLLNALRETPLPVIHKRANSLDCEAYLLWTERMMTTGKENIILCERGILGPNKYTRNTMDLGTVAAFYYQLTGLPVAVDASHGTGRRDLVHPMTLAGIMAGASVILVEAHPNPLIAKSDGYQALFPEQLKNLVEAAHIVWDVRRKTDALYQPSVVFEPQYEKRVEADRKRFFG
ncbi:MAG: 3-deoxy-7-phosphoheptulonate synthase [Candidatus Poribacteria bacterium]|nr:MAG: 3-deoxy-7-phosphoheptulonate synthase [Candidatus Poribacteria bacterium]